MAHRPCAIQRANFALAGAMSGSAASARRRFTLAPAQFDYWKHTQLIIDVVPGRGSGFSLEAPEGLRFLTRSRVFTDAEMMALPPIEVSASAKI